MITGFHKREKDELLCHHCAEASATIALHVIWKPGEPIDWNHGSKYEVYYCQPCAENAIREQDKGCVR